MFTLRTQRRTSLLALLVLLWGLVFPALGQAGVGDTGAVWTEICTAQGLQKIHLDADDAGTADSRAIGHCVLCCVGGVLAAPVQLSVGALYPDVHRIPFPQLNVALPELRILLSAPPRAPPFLSEC